MQHTEIPIVVVTWNAGPKFIRWLDTVEKLELPPSYRVRPMIVDNGSSDNTAVLIGKAISDGAIRQSDVNWLPANYGFAKAQNVVFRRLIVEGTCPLVATLNEDATAEPSWLCRLLEVASVKSSAEKIGMWGGPIYSPETAQKVVSSAGHWIRWKDAACLDVDWNVYVDSSMLRCFEAGFEPFSPCFAASLWSVEMLKDVGLPDSEQFLYYDDVDLAYAARLRGWRARFVKTAIAFHPVPRKKPRGSLVWRHQQKGRLGIVCRYLPDQERTRILAELTDDLREIYDEAIWEGRRLTPVESLEQRLSVWNEWAAPR